MKTFIFISHPYANDPEYNMKNVRGYEERTIANNCIPLSPLALFSSYKNDCDRKEILAVCKVLIKQSDIIHMIKIDGKLSKGQEIELQWAIEMNKPIVFIEENYGEGSTEI